MARETFSFNVHYITLLNVRGSRAVSPWNWDYSLLVPYVFGQICCRLRNVPWIKAFYQAWNRIPVIPEDSEFNREVIRPIACGRCPITGVGCVTLTSRTIVNHFNKERARFLFPNYRPFKTATPFWKYWLATYKVKRDRIRMHTCEIFSLHVPLEPLFVPLEQPHVGTNGPVAYSLDQAFLLRARRLGSCLWC